MTFRARLSLSTLGLTVLVAGCAVNPAVTKAPATTTSLAPVVTPTLTAVAEPTPTITPEPSDFTMPSETASTSKTPESTSGSVTGQPVDAQVAGRLMPSFMAYYAAIDQVLQAGGRGAPTSAMRATMTGAVLTQWTNQAATYAAKGYRQTGATRVESFSPGGLDAKAGKASVDFCANADEVKVVDASGAVVPPTDPAKRALGGTAKLIYSGGAWRVYELAGLTPVAACP